MILGTKVRPRRLCTGATAQRSPRVGWACEFCIGIPWPPSQWCYPPPRPIEGAVPGPADHITSAAAGLFFAGGGAAQCFEQLP